MKTIQDLYDMLQEAENNGIFQVGTQNVKRHIESIQQASIDKSKLLLADVSNSEAVVCENKGCFQPKLRNMNVCLNCYRLGFY